MTDLARLYIFASPTDRLMKVGLSKDPAKRMREVMSETGRMLELWYVGAPAPRRQTKNREASLHAKFDRWWTEDEWFTLPGADAVAELSKDTFFDPLFIVGHLLKLDEPYPSFKKQGSEGYKIAYARAASCDGYRAAVADAAKLSCNRLYIDWLAGWREFRRACLDLRNGDTFVFRRRSGVWGEYIGEFK